MHEVTALSDFLFLTVSENPEQQTGSTTFSYLCLPPWRLLMRSVALLCSLMSLQAWTVELGNKPLDRAMGNANLKLLMTALLSVVGSIAQDIHETLQLRQNLRKLIEAELDNPADDDSTPSLDENYVKTLQELNISSFKKNPYFTNTTVQHVFLPQCAVGNS